MAKEIGVSFARTRAQIALLRRAHLIEQVPLQRRARDRTGDALRVDPAEVERIIADWPNARQNVAQRLFGH